MAQALLPVRLYRAERPLDGLLVPCRVSIFANGGMLAPNLDGGEIRWAATCFFAWRLMRWHLGPRNAECGTGKTESCRATRARIAKKEKYNARPQQSH